MRIKRGNGLGTGKRQRTFASSGNLLRLFALRWLFRLYGCSRFFRRWAAYRRSILIGASGNNSRQHGNGQYK